MTAASSHNLLQEGKEAIDPQSLVKDPIVSVLMLAYNHGPYLEQAIDCVLAQHVDLPIEILIGEDCSTDNTREIALRYQDLNPQVIRVFVAKQNSGPIVNLRRILVAARGTFYAYIDGDDYWLPGKLARQVAYLREHADCAAVYTNALTVDQDGNTIGLFNDVGDEQFDLAALVRRGNFLNHSSVLYRATSRHLLLGLGAPAIDYRIHLLLARTGLIAHMASALTAYRVASGSSMIANDNNQVRQLYWEALTSVPRELISDDDFARGIADFIRRVSYRALRTRQTSLLKEWIPRAIAASPYGAIRTSMLAVGSIIRIACKELAGRIRIGANGRRMKVLYRR